MVVEVAMILDTSKRFSYHDKNEVKWVFTYQDISNDEGWYVWMTRPGQIEICVGRTTEEEIVKKLNENPPLTDNDLIDLELWMLHGGLQAYEPRKKGKNANRHISEEK